MIVNKLVVPFAGESQFDYVPCTFKRNLRVNMARKYFYSFQYIPDNWRAAKIRNMGVMEGNQSVSDNDWEAVKKGGDSAIEKWINDQLHGRSCTVVLIGSGTAGRKWINYEIKKTWDDKKGLGNQWLRRRSHNFRGHVRERLSDQTSGPGLQGSHSIAYRRGRHQSLRHPQSCERTWHDRFHFSCMASRQSSLWVDVHRGTRCDISTTLRPCSKHS
jgi:MTH538 TIR-like domain (DUF1863)